MANVGVFTLRRGFSKTKKSWIKSDMACVRWTTYNVYVSPLDLSHICMYVCMHAVINSLTKKTLRTLSCHTLLSYTYKS